MFYFKFESGEEDKGATATIIAEARSEEERERSARVERKDEA